MRLNVWRSSGCRTQRTWLCKTSRNTPVRLCRTIPRIRSNEYYTDWWARVARGGPYQFCQPLALLGGGEHAEDGEQDEHSACHAERNPNLVHPQGKGLLGLEPKIRRKPAKHGPARLPHDQRRDGAALPGQRRSAQKRAPRSTTHSSPARVVAPASAADGTTSPTNRNVFPHNQSIWILLRPDVPAELPIAAAAAAPTFPDLPAPL